MAKPVATLNASAPSWQPSRLSVNAPSWTPGARRTPTASPVEGSNEGNNVCDDNKAAPAPALALNTSAKKFSFNGHAKPFTPPSISGGTTPTSSTTTTTTAPSSAFPTAPVVQPAMSKLAASATPFTPKTVAQKASPASLDPTARAFTPASKTTPQTTPSSTAGPTPEQKPQVWRKTRSFDAVDCLPDANPRNAGMGRRVNSFEELPRAASTSSLTEEELAKTHPLCTPWSLWYRSASKPNETTDSWQGGLKPIYEMSTVETFWGVFNRIKAPSSLTKGATYYLFRKDIKPMWEDPECCQGGEWKVWLPQAPRKTDVDAVWIMLTLQCIGEQFSTAKDVCGCAVETRAKNDRISLWTKTTDKTRSMAIGRQLKQLLSAFVPADQPYVFTFHSKALSGNDKDASYFITK
eukprot:TRINITY_DN1017_c4_g1_i1.p1 TRINITY_DN1017_c4_g1~~TRINITY_DN1017_c4_g1_i1.p1  ORF type:complete len:408 (+),score=73.26 TRINITY_DN1017_c4_g1_i1:165-1388(+)